MNPEQSIQTSQNTENKEILQVFLPTKNMPALIGYYCGIFGLIPFLGLPLSIAAVILGKIGLSKYKTNPTPGAKAHALVSLILGITELVIFAIFIIFVILIYKK